MLDRKIIAAAVTLAASTLAAFTPAASTLSAQEPVATPALTAEQWRSDLRFLMQSMEKTHKNMYHTTRRASFDSAVKDLDARIPSLARHEIIAGMMRIVAMVGDGHTNIYPSRDRVIGFRTLPVALYLFKDGMFIRAADSSHADLVGSRVVKIGDASLEEAYARVKPYVGHDNEMGVKFWSAYLLAMPEMLHALRLSTSPDSARLELEKSGKRRSVWLRAAGPVQMTPSDTDLSWWRRAGWVDARDRSPTPDPLWLTTRPDSTFWWFTRLPGTRSGYAQINQVRNGDKESFEDFSERLLHFTDTAGLDRLIIDLRLNRGGNGALLKPLERGLLRRPNINQHGRLFILTGRSTWSAAQFFLNDIAEFGEPIFIGEPSGSKRNAYGDSRQIKLPNSGITARASIYYWQDGFPTETSPWIPPDVAAELTFADYAADRDRALAAALAYKPGPSLTDEMRSLVKAGDTLKARARYESYRADPAHAYVDRHKILDDVALYFYNRKDIPRATWAFALAAEEFPRDARAHLNLAAMYQNSGNQDLERAALRRVIDLDPSNSAAAARLRALSG